MAIDAFDADFYVAQLDALSAGGDQEVDHATADGVLADALEALGQKKIADAYWAAQERVGFWYA